MVNWAMRMTFNFPLLFIYFSGIVRIFVATLLLLFFLATVWENFCGCLLYQQKKYHIIVSFFFLSWITQKSFAQNNNDCYCCNWVRLNVLNANIFFTFGFVLAALEPKKKQWIKAQMRSFFEWPTNKLLEFFLITA